jgi:hypothetical protein
MRARRIDTPKLGGIRRAPSNTGEVKESFILPTLSGATPLQVVQTKEPLTCKAKRPAVGESASLSVLGAALPPLLREKISVRV